MAGDKVKSPKHHRCFNLTHDRRAGKCRFASHSATLSTVASCAVVPICWTVPVLRPIDPSEAARRPTPKGLFHETRTDSASRRHHACKQHRLLLPEQIVVPPLGHVPLGRMRLVRLPRRSVRPVVRRRRRVRDGRGLRRRPMRLVWRLRGWRLRSRRLQRMRPGWLRSRGLRLRRRGLRARLRPRPVGPAFPSPPARPTFRDRCTWTGRCGRPSNGRRRLSVLHDARSARLPC
jgi:hypothetical protein